MIDHDCVYGVTNDGKEIDACFLSSGGYPKIKMKDGSIIIGHRSSYLDKRRNIATHYKFCPYCGEKLDYESIKRLVNDDD